MMKKSLALALALIMGLTLSACGQSERYPQIADMLDAGEYENAMLAIYEMYREQNPITPTADPELERKYNTLTCALESLEEYTENRYDMSSFSFVYFDGYEHIAYEGMDAVAWLYDTAKELGDYENARQIAGSFTVLENVPLEKVYSYTDALGNRTESSRVYYVYDRWGNLLSQSLDAGAVADHYLYNYGTPEYTYDENGAVSTLRYLSGSTVNCVIDYTYNEDGTVATERYRDRAGNEYSITYRYENGVLLRAEGVPYAEGSKETMTVEYVYDDNGRLILESGISDRWDSAAISKFLKTVRYTYDENGRVAAIRKATEYSGKEQVSDTDRALLQYQDVREWTFTYDAEGKLIQNTYAVIGTMDPQGNPLDGSYRIYTGNTRYGTYYAYNPNVTELR